MAAFAPETRKRSGQFEVFWPLSFIVTAIHQYHHNVKKTPVPQITQRILASAMTRLLFLTPITPGPSGNGLAMRAWGTKQALSSLGELHTFVLPIAETARVSGEAKNVTRIATIDPRKAAASWISYDRGRKLLAHVGKLPERARLAAPAYGEEILRLLRTSRYDLVYVLRLYIAGTVLPLMNRLPETRFLMDVDENDFAVTRQMADLQKSSALRTESEIQKAFALQALTWFDTIACSSQAESEHLRKLTGLAAVCLPNIVSPVTQSRPIGLRAAGGGGPFRLLFIGNLDYWPNRDALIQLLTDIFPRIRQEIDGSELLIAGAGADEIKAAHGNDPGVQWLGFVDDVSPLYYKANVCVIPLRAGGGSRVKILEAFDRGVSVVASARALEGLSVSNGTHVLMGTNSAEMVAAVKRIANNPILAASLIDNARQYVRLEHTPYRLEQRLCAVVNQLLGAKA